MAINFFSTFSYFETLTSNGYLSLFPSGPNKCVFTKKIPENGTSVFRIDSDDILGKLNCFLKALKDNNFGFSDFFFLHNLPTSFSATELINFYKSLYYKDGVIEYEICRVQIRSTLDPSFSKTCYLKDTSLPQEALDTFVFFCNTSTGMINTALGNKRQSDLITVSFPDNPVSLLKVGMFGTIILGEHLEAYEKKEMNDAYALYLDNLGKTGKKYMKISDRAVKPAMRALAEEFGLKSSDFKFETYIVGKDTQDGRDPRYWTFGKSGEYGYKRKSESLMVAMVAKCEAPVEIPDPEDLSECSKGVIISVDYALREFSTTGKLGCAFPSHPRQFEMCVQQLPNLI